YGSFCVATEPALSRSRLVVVSRDAGTDDRGDPSRRASTRRSLYVSAADRAVVAHRVGDGESLRFSAPTPCGAWCWGIDGSGGVDGMRTPPDRALEKQRIPM